MSYGDRSMWELIKATERGRARLGVPAPPGPTLWSSLVAGLSAL
jgi:hypothetical protein